MKRRPQLLGQILRAIAAVVLIAMPPLARAQSCTGQWTGFDVSGLGGYAWALAWSANPAGGGPARLFAGGNFTAPGSHIAAYDPTLRSWSTLSSGTNGVVRAILVLPNGDVIAGGSFSAAGGVTAHSIARWN